MARPGGNKKACEKYKMSGRREENKKKRQERHLKRIEKMKRRQERISSGELVPKKREISEDQKMEREKRRKDKALNRLMASVKKAKPLCTNNGVVWGIDKDALK